MDILDCYVYRILAGKSSNLRRAKRALRSSFILNVYFIFYGVMFEKERSFF